MYLVRRILVGVEMPTSRPWNAANLEPPSRFAVRQAFQLAASASLPVSLVSVLPEPSRGWFSSFAEAEVTLLTAQQEATEVLRDLARQYTHEPDEQTGVTCVVACGTPWLELLRTAGNAADTLIICGTRNTGAVGRALFGSTGLKLIRNAAGPVWLVRPLPDDDAVLDILALTDLTEVGQDVLTTSVTVARTLPSRLHALHVVDEPTDRYLRHTGISAERLAELRNKSRDDAEHRLQDQLAATDFRTLPNGVKSHVVTGDAGETVLDTIRDLKINLVVMATHARGGVAGMLLGNTAERLLPDLPCSLLVIKPDDFVSPIAAQMA